MQEWCLLKTVSRKVHKFDHEWKKNSRKRANGERIRSYSDNKQLESSLPINKLGQGKLERVFKG